MRTYLIALFCLLLTRAVGQQIDPTFTPFVYSKASTRVLHLSDGNFLLYGRFDNYDGVFTGPLVKVDATGKRVNGFQLHSGRDNVKKVIELSSGKLLVLWGNNGAQPGSLSRLNADGSIDPAFAPAYPVTDVSDQPGLGILVIHWVVNQSLLKRLTDTGAYDNSVTSTLPVDQSARIMVASDNRVYVIRYVISGNTATGTNITRLQPDGTTDNSFSFFSSTLLCDVARFQSDGRMVLGMHDITSSSPKAKVIRLNTDGSQDNSLSSAVYNDIINAMELRSSGNMVLGFSGGDVIELLPTGTLFANITSVGGGLIESIYRDNADHLFITGGFGFALGVQNQAGFVRLKPNNTADVNFRSYAYWANGYRNLVAAQSDGKLLVAGSREFMGVMPAVAPIVRLNPNGQIDPTFQSAITQVPDIYSMVVQADDKIVCSGANIVPGIQSTFGRFLPDGARDLSFNIGDGPQNIAGPGQVSIVAQFDGNLYVAGNFSFWNGSPASNFVILNKDGVWIGPAVNALPPGNSSIIQSIYKQSDGKILLNGYFTLPSGSRRLIRLHPDGSLDNSFAIQLPSGYVVVAGTDPVTDDIYIGGSYLDNLTTRMLVRYDKNGIRIGDFELSVLAGSFASSVIGISSVQVVNDYIVCAGQMGTYQTKSAAGFLVVRKDGMYIDPGVTYDNSSISYQTHRIGNSVYVTGRFRELNTGAMSGIARVQFSDTPLTLGNFAAEGVDPDKIRLTWIGTQPSFSHLRLERSTSASGPFQVIAELPLTARTYTDGGLTEASTYFYRISGATGSSLGTPLTANASTGIWPIAQLNVANLQTTSFEVTWTERAVTEYYLVQLSKDNFATLLNGADGQQVHQGFARFENLSPETTYQVRVKRIRNGQSSGFVTTSATTMSLTLDNNVTEFKITGRTESSITLSWTGTFPAATHVVVQRSMSPSSDFVTIDELPAAVTTYISTGLQEATRYYYRIAGKKAPMLTAFSNTNGFTDILPVTGVSHSQVTDRSFVGQWTLPPSTDSVQVQVSLNNFSSNTVNKFLKGSSATFSNLLPGTRYRLRVRRYRNGISSPFLATGDILLTGQPPAFPVTNNISRFEVSNPSTSTLELSWTGEFDGADKLVIEQSVTTNDNFNRIAELPLTARKYAATQLNEGSRYHYRLVGISVDHSSAPSEGTGVTIVAAAEALQPTSITSNSFIASWKYPPTAGGTDSVQFQLSTDEFATVVPAFTRKFVKADFLPITGLDVGTYWYRVIRFRSGMASAPSAAVMAKLGVVTGLDEVAGISCYPNPVEDFLIIDAGTLALSVRLFQTSGALQYESQGSGLLSIDMRDQAAGVYVLVLTRDGATSRRKVIKR